MNPKPILPPKKLITAILLSLIILTGFFLRSYHLNFPSIGYHNMKENEYIGETLFMLKDGDYLHRKLFRMGIDELPNFEAYPQMPILPWMFVILWKLFGVKLWLARLVIIAFSLGSIPLLYLIVRKLSNKKSLALLSGLLLSLMPLGVFFGRNIQPESPALFFLLLCIYFSLRWFDDFNLKSVVYSGLSLCVSILFKFTFLIGVIPLLGIFPFNKLKNKDSRNKILKGGLYFLFCLLPAFIWVYVEKMLFVKETLTSGGTIQRINIFEIFGSSYWKDNIRIISSYLNDNYTFWYFALFLIGLTFSLSRPKEKLNRFILFFTAALIPYWMFLSDYTRQHSYYQMPFLPLIIISSAYGIYQLSNLFLKNVKLQKLVPVILILASLPALKSAISRQYDTIFYGLDVAAEYLKSHLSEDERFFVLGSAQSVAVCTLSQRLCGFSYPQSLEEMRLGEEKRNMKWLFVYGDYGMYELRKDRRIFQYAQNNYSLAQIGLLRSQNNLIPIYYLFKKGGKFNFDQLKNIPEKPKLAKTYQTTQGKIEFYTLNLTP